MKKLIAAALLLCMVLALVACAETTPDATTTQTPSTQAPTTTQPVPTTTVDNKPQPNYFITVVDTEGKPVSGALLQMCKLGDDGACTPAGTMTDAEGKVNFTMAEDSYKVSFIILPAGYSYVDGVDAFYFAEGSNELTIVLAKA